MKVLDRKKKHAFWLRALWVGAFAASLFLFLKERQTFIVEQASNALESWMSREVGLEIEIEKTAGDLRGTVTFSGVRVRDEDWQGKPRDVFLAKAIIVRYRLLDLISKNLVRRMEIEVLEPVVYWRPRLQVRNSKFSFFAWMHELQLPETRQVYLTVKNMTLVLGSGENPLTGIDMMVNPPTFHIDAPIRHWPLGRSDVSTFFRIAGLYERGSGLVEEAFVGHLATEGTVVNWMPVSKESIFEFTFSEADFVMHSTDAVGGLKVEARVDFQSEYDLELQVHGQDYPLSYLKPFVAAVEGATLPERMDLDLGLRGAPWAPQVRLDARVYRGFMGSQFFRVMDVHGDGVYPTLVLSGSRIVTEDGTAMRFANSVVDMKELLDSATYERLVAESGQDAVAWGRWQLSRENSVLEGPNAESGLEYSLKSKNLIKIGVREEEGFKDEGFVGVERKMKF